VQPHARAPSRAIGRPWQTLHLDLSLESRHPLQRLDEHLGLHGALMSKFDMAELGAAGPIVRVAVDCCFCPDVGLAVRAWVENPHGVGAPETGLGVIGDPGDHPLAGDGV